MTSTAGTYGRALVSAKCVATGAAIFQLCSAPIKAHFVKISQRRLGETSGAQLACYVGDDAVTTLTGQELAAPAANVALDSVELRAAPGGVLDLSTIYVRFLQANDGVSYIYQPV